jgi:hypothetical protein
MDQPKDPPPAVQTAGEPEPQTCCHCGIITHQPVKIGEAWSSGGAGRNVYACPQDAAHYGFGSAQ